MKVNGHLYAGSSVKGRGDWKWSYGGRRGGIYYDTNHTKNMVLSPAKNMVLSPAKAIEYDQASNEPGALAD